MSLGPINKEPIGDKGKVLKPDQLDLMVPSQESKIKKTAGQLTNSRKLSFEPTPVSSEAPVISDEELKTWLMGMINVVFIKEKTGSLREFTPRRDVLEKKVECYFPEIQLIAKEFPKVVSALINNYDVKCYIVPSDEKVLKLLKERGVEFDSKDCGGRVIVEYLKDSTNKIRLNVLLWEKDILSEDGDMYLNTVSPHEFLHLINICAADLNGVSRRVPPLTYSELLNKRLGGKLEAISERLNKNAFKAEKELSSLVDPSTEEKLKVYGKSKCMVRIGETKDKISISRPITNLDVKEILVYSLDLYLRKPFILKKIDREMYEIIEKYVLPDLR